MRLPGEPSRTWRSFEEPEKPSTDSGFLDGPGHSTDSADLSYPVVHFKLQEIGQETVLEGQESTVHEEKDEGSGATALAANRTVDKPEVSEHKSNLTVCMPHSGLRRSERS